MILRGNYSRTFLATIFPLLLLLPLADRISAQNESFFLGIKLRPDVKTIADEIERKTNRKIYAEFADFEEDSTLGVSYISEKGTAIVRVNANLRDESRKTEAVITHELLHLRLRANGYPVFLFSPTVKTKRGLAQDVEQSNVNDLASLIEHRIFKSEMDKFGLNAAINLAGDTEWAAIKRKGEEDGQADAINFARAILEYQNQKDVENLRRIYLSNQWKRAVQSGQEIADIIKTSTLNSPSASASVFLLCAAKLYPSPRPFKLTYDKSVKAYRQMLIGF